MTGLSSLQATWRTVSPSLFKSPGFHDIVLFLMESESDSVARCSGVSLVDTSLKTISLDMFAPYWTSFFIYWQSEVTWSGVCPLLFRQLGSQWASLSRKWINSILSRHTSSLSSHRRWRSVLPSLVFILWLYESDSIILFMVLSSISSVLLSHSLTISEKITIWTWSHSLRIISGLVAIWRGMNFSLFLILGSQWASESKKVTIAGLLALQARWRAVLPSLFIPFGFQAPFCKDSCSSSTISISSMLSTAANRMNTCWDMLDAPECISCAITWGLCVNMIGVCPSSLVKLGSILERESINFTTGNLLTLQARWRTLFPSLSLKSGSQVLCFVQIFSNSKAIVSEMSLADATLSMTFESGIAPL